jgi:hypothetical protein
MECEDYLQKVSARVAPILTSIRKFSREQDILVCTIQGTSTYLRHACVKCTYSARHFLKKVGLHLIHLYCTVQYSGVINGIGCPFFALFYFSLRSEMKRIACFFYFLISQIFFSFRSLAQL